MKFNRSRLLVQLAATLCALAATGASAGVSLQGQPALVASLKAQPACCVIDARSAAQRRKHPLADALPYKPGLRIVPTAAVVVVADDDKQAQKVGAALARQHPGKSILAVQGGVLAWEASLKALEGTNASTAHGAGKSYSFVIPHNTCETGQPLQVLTSKPKP